VAYIPENAKWYLAALIKEIVVEGDSRNVVHKNLVLVRADSPEQAYQNALDLGKQSEICYENPAVCLTEMRGPVSCISCDDGKLQWMFDPGPETHILRAHYSSRLNAFFGVLRNLNNKHNRRLLRFDVSSGVCERVCDLDSDAWEIAFLDAADQLVTTSGEIRNLSDGALAGRLAFPQREYPGM